MVGLAAILVMKIVSSSYFQYVDVEGGRRAFNTAISLLRKCSVEDNDLKGRMSKILAQLWGVHLSDRAMRDQVPSLRIKSRFCTSMLHDSLWLWREKFGGPGYSAAPQPPSGPESTSSKSGISPAQRLDTSVDYNLPMSVPSSNFVPPEIRTQEAQDDLALSDHLNYAQSGQSAGFLQYDYDMAQEEHDWMWNLGLSSMLPENLDFYPTTSDLGFIPQNQM